MKTKHSPETLAKIVSDLERQAYKRGWNEAVAAMADQVAKMADAAGLAKAPEVEAKAGNKPLTARKPRSKKRGARAGNARKLVTQAIGNNPGKLGNEIAFMVMDKVNKHTVRTWLRKLKIAGDIEQHEMRWYAKGAYRQVA
ncbi:MAG TPA: hypothetical protein VNW15_15310 [Rhizomicrobium sp.]|jgi:hypothetical protein|nr:hypothetical protein [Rhizomicrobium sp.]